MSRVNELFQNIVSFDCEPSVFTVDLQKSDHRSGYEVYINFRSTSNDGNQIGSIVIHNDDPITALEVAWAQLQERFGKCPHCGNYRHEEEKS
jgi:hypothetical protein